MLRVISPVLLKGVGQELDHVVQVQISSHTVHCGQSSEPQLSGLNCKVSGSLGIRIHDWSMWKAPCKMLNCLAVWVVKSSIQVVITGNWEVTQELVFTLFLHSSPCPPFKPVLSPFYRWGYWGSENEGKSLRIQDQVVVDSGLQVMPSDSVQCSFLWPQAMNSSAEGSCQWQFKLMHVKNLGLPLTHSKEGEFSEGQPSLALYTRSTLTDWPYIFCTHSSRPTRLLHVGSSEALDKM